MVNLKDSVSKLVKGLGGSLREFPLEALLGVTYFVVFLFESSVREALGKSDVFYLFFWFFPHYVLLFTLHKWSGKHLVFRVLYCLSWFLWIPLLVWGSVNPGWSLGVAYIIAIVLLIIGKEPLGNEPYGQNILDTVINVAAGFIIGFLLIAVVDIIIASVNFLFDLDLKDKWFTHRLHSLPSPDHLHGHSLHLHREDRASLGTAERRSRIHRGHFHGRWTCLPPFPAPC